MRAITGGKRGTSHANLYKDTGLEPLKSRRQNQKLTLMFKIKTNQTTEALTRLLPNRTEERKRHNLRNNDDLSVPKTNTTTLLQSFIPSTIRAWNNLNLTTRKLRSLAQFKEAIATTNKKPPKYFYKSKDRVAEIHHAPIRLQCSNLNEDLYNRNLSPSPMCKCNEEIEDLTHTT